MNRFFNAFVLSIASFISLDAMKRSAEDLISTSNQDSTTQTEAHFTDEESAKRQAKMPDFEGTATNPTIIYLKYNPDVEISDQIKKGMGNKKSFQQILDEHELAVADSETELFNPLLNEQHMLELKAEIERLKPDEFSILKDNHIFKIFEEYKPILAQWQNSQCEPSKISIQFCEIYGQPEEFSIANEVIKRMRRVLENDNESKRDFIDCKVAYPITEKQAPVLFSIVKNMTTKLNLKMIKSIRVVNQNTHSIDCAESILYLGLDHIKHQTNNELEFIIGHELGHYKNSDQQAKVDSNKLFESIEKNNKKIFDKQMPCFLLRMHERIADDTGIRGSNPIALISNFLKGSDDCAIKFAILHESRVSPEAIPDIEVRQHYEDRTHPFHYERICYAFSQIK